MNSVLIGQRGLVHVWGRNDMANTQRMGVDWTVKDPDGITVETHTEFEALPYTSPGDDHEFTGGRFDLNKAGNWTIKIELLMNPDDPMVVDTYDGVLCVVTEEFAGTIVKKELEYDETRGDIPVT